MKKIFFSMLFAFLAIAMSGVAGVVTLSPDAGEGAVWYRVKGARAGKYVYAKPGEQLYMDATGEVKLNQLWCFIDNGEEGIAIANAEVEGYLNNDMIMAETGRAWSINETKANNGYGIGQFGADPTANYIQWWNQAGGANGTRVGQWSSNEKDAGSAWLFEEVSMDDLNALLPDAIADAIANAEKALAGLEVGEKTWQISEADKAAFAEVIAAAKEAENADLEIIRGLKKAEAAAFAARVQPIPVEIADGERFMLKEVNTNRYIVKSGDLTWKEHKVTFDPEGELIDFGATSTDFPEGNVTPEKAIIIAHVDNNGLRFLDASTTTDEKEGRIRVGESIGFIKVVDATSGDYLQYAKVTKNSDGLCRIQTSAGYLCADIDNTTNIVATSDEYAFVFELERIAPEIETSVAKLTDAINGAEAMIDSYVTSEEAKTALTTAIATAKEARTTIEALQDKEEVATAVATAKTALTNSQIEYINSAIVIPSVASAPWAYRIKHVRSGKYVYATAADAAEVNMDADKADSKDQMWYFVASDEGYKIYNVEHATAVTAAFKMAANGAEWQINTTLANNGYGIGPVGDPKTNTTWWNQFGGSSGKKVGGWQSNEQDSGSAWVFELDGDENAILSNAIATAEDLLKRFPAGTNTYNSSTTVAGAMKQAVERAKALLNAADKDLKLASVVELNSVAVALKASRVQPVVFEPEENDLYLIRRTSDDSTLNLGWSTQWNEYKLTYDSIGTAINDEHSVAEALFFVGIAKEGEESYYVFKENTANWYVRMTEDGFMGPDINRDNMKMRFAKNQDGQIRIEVKGNKYVTEDLSASTDETIFPFVFEKQEISGADLKLTAVIAEADSLYNKENLPTAIVDANVERAAFGQAIADAKALLANEEATQLQFLKESEALAEKIKLYQAAVEAAASLETAVTAAETEAAKVYVTENIEAYVDKAEADAFAGTYSAAISTAKEMLAADTATTALLTAAATEMTAATATYVESVTGLLLDQYQVVIDSATALYNDVKQGADAYQASAAARKSIFNAVKNANTVKTNAIQNPAVSYSNDRASVQVGIVNVYDAIAKFRAKVVKSEELAAAMAKGQEILNAGHVNAELSAALEEAELVINEAEEAVVIAKLNGIIASEGIDVLAGVNVYAAEGAIVVEGAEGVIKVVAINGSLVANVEAEAVTTITVEAGTYVVVVNGKSVKVLVK